jgi:hypothetical protein
MTQKRRKTAEKTRNHFDWSPERALARPKVSALISARRYFPAIFGVGRTVKFSA